MNSYGKYSNPEIIGIECDYNLGKYGALEDKLVEFISQNRGTIERVQRRFSSDKLLALKLLLLQRRSINASAEISMQLDEIRKEARYSGNPDYDSVACDWAKSRAAGWREHYTLVLGFILETRKEKFQRLLEVEA